MSGWVLDPPLLALAVASGLVYVRGHRRRASLGGSRRSAARCFATGWTLTVLSHVTPLALWSETAFAPHMVQHLVLTIVAAPLLAAGAPVSTMRLALPPGTRRSLARATRRTRRWRRPGAPHPLVLATVAHVATIWAWHLPVAYDAALASAGWHLLEHLAFLGSAVWFWSELRRTAVRDPLLQGLATLCLGAMIVQGGVLGALLTFAGRPLYAAYGAGGPDALADQQLAGGLMWVPPAFVYAPVAIRRFIAWFEALEQHDPPRRPGGRPVERPAPGDGERQASSAQ